MSLITLQDPDKDLKKEFRKTNLGANFYKKSIIFDLLFCLAIVAEVVIYFINDKFDPLDLMSIVDYLVFILSIHYNAKFSGAFAQFKESKGK